MKRNDAEKLVFLVQDPESLKAIHGYATLRISWLKEQFIHCQNMDQVLRLQGAISELDRIFKLKDEVMNPTE